MTILIINDNKVKSDQMRDILEKHGHIVNTAEDGKEGILRSLHKKYDLIFLNWLLQGLSGEEVCRLIRNRDQRTPILFLTNTDSLENTIIGLKSGANDYFKEPYSAAELLSRISIYALHLSDIANEYYLSDIKICLQTHKVFKGNKQIGLTKKEFILVTYLLKNKGKVCRRSELLEHVWGTEHEFNPGVIDVYINAIRKKLNLSKDNPILRTIRGIGFIAEDSALDSI